MPNTSATELVLFNPGPNRFVSMNKYIKILCKGLIYWLLGDWKSVVPWKMLSIASPIQTHCSLTNNIFVSLAHFEIPTGPKFLFGQPSNKVLTSSTLLNSVLTLTVSV